MHALILIGSRDPEGRTAKAVKALMAGITEGGGTAEPVWLTEREIRMCEQCNPDGWGQCLSDGTCKFPDDFADLLDRVRKCDVAVFATPVYWSDWAERLQAFVNRMRRVAVNKQGRQGIADKPAVAICVAGGGGGGSYESAQHLVTALGHCGMDVLDAIPCRRQNLELKLEVLKATGRWLAKRPARKS